MRLRSLAAGLAVVAALALCAPAAHAQWAVHDDPLTQIYTQNSNQTNSKLDSVNRKLDRAVELLQATAELMKETALNTSGSLDQQQRTAQSVGDPREKAARREIRQKWILGGQGYGQIASAADLARPVGASWALRLNQARTDRSDVRPSIDVLADPGMAARFSRQAYSLANATDTSQVARSNLETRRRAEQNSAVHDAHGMALHSVLATSTMFKRADRLLSIADEAYEAGISDQLFALNMSVVALLEEQGAMRGLMAQYVRSQVANQMVASPAYGANAPVLAPADGRNADSAWEYGLGSASAAGAGGTSTGAVSGSAADIGLTRTARGGSDSWSFAQALDYSTAPGDYMSSIGGIGGVGCPYSMMQGARGSGCASSVARLLLGETGMPYGAQRTIMSVMSGGLSANSLGVRGTTIDLRSISNMFGLGGLMSCFGGNPSTCSYSCQRLATERMPGGRCDQQGFGDSVLGASAGSSGFCRQMEYACNNEMNPF